MSDKHYTKTTDGYTEYDGSYSLKGANVSGKYSAHHLEQCRGANSSGSSDVAYVKGKAGISPVSGAGGRGKVGLVKVREDIGPVRVRAEALSADVGANYGWTGNKLKANASLAKCQIDVGNLAGIQTGLSVDNKVKADVWPPQVGAYVCGTGLETGWRKTKLTILGNGVVLRNPFAARKPLCKD